MAGKTRPVSEFSSDDFATPEASPSFRGLLFERMLKSLLPPDVSAKLTSGRWRSLIVKTSTFDVAEALVKPLRARFPEALVFSRTKPDKYAHDGDAMQLGLEEQRLVICASQSPDECVASSFLSVVDARLTLAPLKGIHVEGALREFTGQSVTPALRHLDFAQLTVDEICACVSATAPVRTSIDRLKRAIARKAERQVAAQASAADVPKLTDAQGYGPARDWALALKLDMDDYKAGRIPWEDLDRGVCLHGPSGTGKTLFARVVANACQVPFIPASISELFRAGRGHLGDVVRTLRETFEEAARRAPAILFLDELDALPDRNALSGNRDFWTPVITDLMLLLDSSVPHRKGVVVIAATNRLSDVDPALLRSGRLERSIWIGPPDAASLAGILRFYLADNLSGADLLSLCRTRPGATGADAMAWARAARRAARQHGGPMTIEDLSKQIVLPDPRDQAQLYRTACHEAGHAVTSVLLKVDDLEDVSIERSKAASGLTRWRRRIGDLATRDDLERQVMVALAGRAAEQMLSEDIPSSSAGGDQSSDLALATNLVTMWRTSLGLSSDLTWRGPPDQTLALLAMDAPLRALVEADLQTLMVRTRQLITANKESYRAVASALLIKRTLDGAAVRAILEFHRAEPAGAPPEGTVPS